MSAVKTPVQLLQSLHSLQRHARAGDGGGGSSGWQEEDGEARQLEFAHWTLRSRATTIWKDDESLRVPHQPLVFHMLVDTPLLRNTNDAAAKQLEITEGNSEVEECYFEERTQNKAMSVFVAPLSLPGSGSFSPQRLKHVTNDALQPESHITSGLRRDRAMEKEVAGAEVAGR